MHTEAGQLERKGGDKRGGLAPLGHPHPRRTARGPALGDPADKGAAAPAALPTAAPTAPARARPPLTRSEERSMSTRLFAGESFAIFAFYHPETNTSDQSARGSVGACCTPGRRRRGSRGSRAGPARDSLLGAGGGGGRSRLSAARGAARRAGGQSVRGRRRSHHGAARPGHQAPGRRPPPQAPAPAPRAARLEDGPGAWGRGAAES
jgi:hypothetical protein